MLSGIFITVAGSYLLATNPTKATDYDYENWYCNHFKGTPTGACFGKAGGNEYKYTCLDEYTIIYEEYPSGDCSSGLGSPTTTITYTIVDPYDSSDDNHTNANTVTEYHDAYCNNLNYYTNDDDGGFTTDSSDEDDNGGCSYFAVNKYSASSSTTTGECDGSYETVLILNADNNCYYNNSELNNEYIDYASARYSCAASFVEVYGYSSANCNYYDEEVTVDYTLLYQSQGANECYDFVCSSQKYLYPDIDSYSFFDYGGDIELLDGECNNYDGAPLETCLGNAYDETEYYITCSDTSTITYYTFEMGSCDSSNLASATGTYSFPVDDLDDYVSATCDASSNCEYFLRNDFGENPTVSGFCYGNYESDRTLFMNACYKVDNDNDSGDSGDGSDMYSVMFSCDGAKVSGTAYGSGDCSGDAVSSFSEINMALTVLESDALEECYTFSCNGDVVQSK